MESMISLAAVLFILSMINERIANFIKLQYSEGTLLWIPLGNLKKKKKDGEEDDRDKRIILINIVIGTIVCLMLRADLISIIADIDKPSAGIGWKNFDWKNAANWITLLPGCFLTGCFLSLGAKFWHDLLDLLLFTKNLKGQIAGAWEAADDTRTLDSTEMDKIEQAASIFKQEVINIPNVTTAILNTGSSVPVMEVYTGKDFSNQTLIPKKLFYTTQNNATKSIDVKIIPGFNPSVHSDLWPSTNIINAAPYPANYGSLGGKVYDEATNEAYFLSCYHVVKSIYQKWDFTPRGFESILERTTNQPCGEIVNAIRDDEIDAAIMRANDGFNIQDGINGIGITYAARDLGPGDKRLQTKVKMFGGVTRLLRVGYVSDINVPAYIRYYKDFSTEIKEHRLNKLIFIRSIDSSPFSQPGDSGSLVVDEYNYIIGILVGGQGRLSFVIPVNTILNRLKIKIKP